MVCKIQKLLERSNDVLWKDPIRGEKTPVWTYGCRVHARGEEVCTYDGDAPYACPKNVVCCVVRFTFVAVSGVSSARMKQKLKEKNTTFDVA